MVIEQEINELIKTFEKFSSKMRELYDRGVREVELDVETAKKLAEALGCNVAYSGADYVLYSCAVPTRDGDLHFDILIDKVGKHATIRLLSLDKITI